VVFNQKAAPMSSYMFGKQNPSIFALPAEGILYLLGAVYSHQKQLENIVDFRHIFMLTHKFVVYR
jgi:hypothetical protein